MATAEVQEEDLSPSSMVQYLETVLHQIEAAQGGSDPEASAALAELKHHTAALSRLQDDPSQSPDLNSTETADLAIALDKLDERLGDLEDMIDSADDSTLQILQNSTRLWLSDNAEASEALNASKGDGKTSLQDEQNAAGLAKEVEPDENGPIQSRAKSQIKK